MPWESFDPDFRLSVLGRSELEVECNLQKRVGRRLIVRLSTMLPQDSRVRIDSRDALVLGEVLGCWRQGQSIFGAIELQQTLAGLETYSSAGRQTLSA